MNKHFIIVGAQRSGSTFLRNLLGSHPEVCIAKPLTPEPKYFMKNGPLSVSEYHRFFAHSKKHHTIFGEKSTSYIESEDSARNIARLLPKCKILMILRDPVERAISNYYFTYNFGYETRTPMEVFVDNAPPPKLSKNSPSVNPFSYIERGYYDRFLRMYFRYFPPESIKVLLFEKIINNGFEWGSLLEFLELGNNRFDPQVVDATPPSTRSVPMPAAAKKAIGKHYEDMCNPLERLAKINVRDYWKV